MDGKQAVLVINVDSITRVSAMALFLQNLSRLCSEGEHILQQLDETLSIEETLRGFWDQCLYAGIPVEAALVAAEDVARQCAKAFYVFPRELMRSAQEYGWPVIAISESPQVLLEALLRGLEIPPENIFGTSPPVLSGRYADTEMVSMPARRMKWAIEHIAEDRGYGLEESIGVGSTHNDVSFLEQVGHPIAFRPRRELHRVAQENAWHVYTEENDVLYVSINGRAYSHPVGLPQPIQTAARQRLRAARND